ncbi:hypothetical protein Tco_0575452 [Tanacetum coccineum]
MDGIICRQCSCGWCGNRLDNGFCSFCTSNNNPNFSNFPPQSSYEPTICEICGNDAHFGYDCPTQVPFYSNPKPCFDQNVDYNFPQVSPSFQVPQQQYLVCSYCGGPHYDYQCQPICEPNSSFDYSGFDQPQPPQYSVDQETLSKIQEGFEELKQDWRTLIELKLQIAVDQINAKEDMSIEEMRHEQQLVYDEIRHITNGLGRKRYQGEEIEDEYEKDCELKIHQLKIDFNVWGSKIREKERTYEQEEREAARQRLLSIPFYDDDDSIPIAHYSTITPDQSTEEPDNSLKMGDERLSTISATKSDEVIKSSVENLVPIPSKSEVTSENESECGMPVCDKSFPTFSTFSNPLFDSNDDFPSSDDESFSDEDVPEENFKIYSNPLFEEEIIPTRIDPQYFNTESDLIESLINRDASIVYLSKIDPLFEEFAGELTHINPIPPEIVDTDLATKEEIRLNENLSYDNSSPRPPEEPNSEIADTIIESLSPSPIHIEDSDQLMEEIDLFINSDDLIPPEIESDDYDSEGDIRFLEELLSNDPITLPENESFSLDHFDAPSFLRPPAEPPERVVFENDEDGDSFTFVIWTFLPFFTYHEVSPFSCSTGSEDKIFDPGIFIFTF